MNNTVNSIVTYFKGVKSEWSKINWPEKNQIIAETIFVIAIVAVFTVSVYLIDLVFKGLLGLIPMK
ncbi:preprotein translocase subunit SecE [bacterium]|nr:preprotein translocase subunit SecE [bacterium]